MSLFLLNYSFNLIKELDNTCPVCKETIEFNHF
jgi:hypothetical protein